MRHTITGAAIMLTGIFVGLSLAKALERRTLP